MREPQNVISLNRNLADSEGLDVNKEGHDVEFEGEEREELLEREDDVGQRAELSGDSKGFRMPRIGNFLKSAKGAAAP